MKDKIKGEVTRFTGSLGWIKGVDGRVYFFHREDLITSRSGIRAHIQVRFLPTENEKGLRAAEVEKFLDLKPGHWEYIAGRFRCGDCASNADHPTKYCPHCGAPKEKEDWSWTKYSLHN